MEFEKVNKDIDDYWQTEDHIARLQIPPQDHDHEVFFCWHQTEETYSADYREIGVKINQAGIRDYLHAKACYYTPRLILTVGLAPAVFPTYPDDTIGNVSDVSVEGHNRHFLANLQAWYYRAEKTLMLWEVDMFSHYADSNPNQDFLLKTLWYFFEEKLLEKFPDCQRIITPGSEPAYENNQFQELLIEKGYQPHFDNTFVKLISKDMSVRNKVEFSENV